MGIIAFVIIVIIIAIWLTAAYMSRESAVATRRKKEHARARVRQQAAMVQSIAHTDAQPIVAAPATAARTFQPSPVDMVQRSGS